ncbi:MAG: leukotriene A4 hydrolase C-terminal domain-containing protein [Gemmataceae bacterium]
MRRPCGSRTAPASQEWQHFLEELPAKLTSERMKELDAAFGLTRRTNAEVAFPWLQLAVRHGYEAAYPRVEEFLTTQGRRKFLKPLYEELAKTPAGVARARAIYAKAKPTYHPIAVATVDAILAGK